MAGMAEIILFGMFGLVAVVFFLILRAGKNVFGAERREEGDERNLDKLEREEERDIGIEMRGGMGEQQYEQSEFRYERQIMQNLYQIRNGIAQTIPYSKTSPFAARRYAAAMTPYITNVVKMLRALKTMEQKEENTSQQEKKAVQKTEKVVKKEKTVARDLEKAEKAEEKIDFSGFFNQMGGR